MSRFQQAAASGYLPPYRKQRWLSVLNTTNETIPGFACMYLDPDVDQAWSTEAERGKLIYRVSKPNADCEARQDPALLIANGPMPIPRYSHGWGTQDWPAQVLHDASSGRAANGTSVGPKADNWFFWPARTAFTVQSHDAARAVAHEKTNLHTILVAPAPRPSLPLHEARLGDGASVASLQPFSLPSDIAHRKEPSYLSLWGDPGSAGGVDDGSSDYLTLEFQYSGIYWLGVSGTLSSVDADEGDTLQIGIAKRDVGEETWAPTFLSGYRLQCIEDDSYSGQTAFRTAENVAFSGPLSITKGDQIQLQNWAYSTISAGNLILSAFRLGVDPIESGAIRTAGGDFAWH